MSAQSHTIHISDDFTEVDTMTIDERKRITIGELLKGFKRESIYIKTPLEKS